jgi:hypothetical protein
MSLLPPGSHGLTRLLAVHRETPQTHQRDKGAPYLGFSWTDEVGPRKWRKEVSLTFDVCYVPRTLIGNGPSKLEE